MFKSSRWKSEKTKIKAVFELQFQATQVPHLKGKKKATLSVIPESVGKPSVKQKASIVEGTCTWENPVYETVKLVRESKTGIYKENIYYFIVSTGSSKSSFLGELSLNFADYAEATQPLLLSLPLNFSDYGVILHISIKKMQGTEDKRDVGENEDERMTKSSDRNLRSKLAHCNTNGDDDLNFLDVDDLDISSEDERNLSFKDPQDFAPIKWNSFSQKKRQDDGQTEKQVRQRSNTDWSVGSASDKSMVDSTNSPRENFPSHKLMNGSNDSIEMLRNEISMRDRQVEMSELELQSLRKQIAKESKRGEDLSAKIVSLQAEYAALKTEHEQLKSSKKGIHETELSDLSEDTKKQLKREKDLNKKLRSRLYETEDSNSELILQVNDLNKKLEQKSKAPRELNNDEDNNAKEKDLLKQKITDLCSEVEVYRKDKEELKMHIEDLVADYDVLKQENHDIKSTLRQNQIEQTNMQSKYSDSLATIEELKQQVDILEKQINKQVLEFSKSLNTMNELETEVKTLEKELEKQAREFEEDLEVVNQTKVQQEQRAIRAEEALRKTRWSNATAVERLQDEFKRLSEDMASKLDENEKLSEKRVAEANDLRLQKNVLEDMLQKCNKEIELLKEQYEEKVNELLSRTNQQEKQIEKLLQEVEAKHNQIESFQKLEKGKHSSGIRTSEGDKEREELELQFASATKEIEMLKEELSAVRTLNDEKAISATTLESAMEDLSVQYNELKSCMLQIDLEKETMRKQVFELEAELKKKDEVITNMDKKIQNNGECAPNLNSDTKGTTFRDALSALRPNHHPKKTENTKSLEEARSDSETRLHASKLKGGESIGEVIGMEVLSLFDTLSNGEHELPTCSPSDTYDSTKLASEVASLKQENQHMERELKEMRDKYSEISLKFAEVEGERQQLVMSLRNLKNGKK